MLEECLMKKKIIIIIICLITILGITGYFIYQNLENNKIVATIILDINPSIEINLNKQEKVISVIPLNDDAKDIINDNFKGTSLNNTIAIITDNLIEKGYSSDGQLEILLNTQGNINTKTVENIIKTAFNEKQIETNITTQNITDNAKVNAEKYHITESKAAYIEEIIKDNQELTFEDLKDKSISELNNLKSKQTETTNTEKPEESSPSDDNNNESSNPVNNNGGGYSGGCNPPSNLKDSAWCSFNTSRPQWCEYYYPEKLNEFNYSSSLYSHLGIGQFDSIGGYSSETPDARSSYCSAFINIITTRVYRYTIISDSVTGEIIEERKENVPAFVDENVVKEHAINYFNLTEEDYNMAWVSLNTEAEGAPYWYYRYQVNIEMKDGSLHTVNYNAVTGALVAVIR